MVCTLHYCYKDLHGIIECICPVLIVIGIHSRGVPATYKPLSHVPVEFAEPKVEWAHALSLFSLEYKILLSVLSKYCVARVTIE